MSFCEITVKRIKKLYISGEWIYNTSNSKKKKKIDLVTGFHTRDANGNQWVLAVNQEGEEIARYNTKYAEQIIWYMN